jgi:hypothetical protein
MARRSCSSVRTLNFALRAGIAPAGAEAILGLAAAHSALGNPELAVKLDVIAQEVYDIANSKSWDSRLVDSLREHLRAAWEQTNPLIATALTDQEGPLTMDIAVAELGRQV